MMASYHSDVKPSAAARTSVISVPYTGANGRDIVHQRPPTAAATSV